MLYLGGFEQGYVSSSGHRVVPTGRTWHTLGFGFGDGRIYQHIPKGRGGIIGVPDNMHVCLHLVLCRSKLCNKFTISKIYVLLSAHPCISVHQQRLITILFYVLRIIGLNNSFLMQQRYFYADSTKRTRIHPNLAQSHQNRCSIDFLLDKISKAEKFKKFSKLRIDPKMFRREFFHLFLFFLHPPAHRVSASASVWRRYHWDPPAWLCVFLGQRGL